METKNLSAELPIVESSSEPSRHHGELSRLLAADGLLWASFALFLCCYVARAIWAASRTPLWLDEVLSVWAIRLASASEMWSAVKHGSEFVPPTYNLFLHYYSHLAGASYLALRLPTIATTLIFGLCAFVLFRRYLGSAAAVFGCCMILEILHFYALQIRPYTVSIACFGGALVLWDDLSRRPNSRLRYFSIFALLALAICIHFYSVFFIPCLAITELLHMTQTRRLRLPLWIAMFCAGAITFLWLPLIHMLSQYTAGDAGSSNYYAKPTVAKVLFNYYGLLCESRIVPTLLIAAAVLAAIAKLRGVNSSTPTARASSADFWAMALGVSCLPCVIYIASLFTTKTYTERYTLAAGFGLIALIVGLFSTAPAFRRIVPLVTLFAAALTSTHTVFTYGTFDRPPVYARLTGTKPIVIGDAQQFFTLEESAPDSIRSRIVYLTLPASIALPDPTVVHQLLRWKTINPKLPLQDVESFLKTHDDFFLLDTHAGTDATPTDYLLKRKQFNLIYRDHDGVLLFDSQPLSPVNSSN